MVRLFARTNISITFHQLTGLGGGGGLRGGLRGGNGGPNSGLGL